MDSIKKIKLNNTTYAVGDQRIDDLNETRFGPTIEIDEFGELNQSRIGRAGTYGPESNNTLTVPKITTDEFGRVIEVSTHDIHRVQNVTTGSTNGTVSVDGTDVAVYGLGNAAYKGVATSIGASGSDSYLATEKAVRDAIDVLPEPMIFKGSLGTGGTITSLPTASSSNTGFTYKVIEDGTYASQSAKVGDTFISDGSSWILIPSGDEPSGTVTSIATGNGLTGGPITSSGEISLVPASKAVFGGIVVGEGLYTTSVHCGFETLQIVPHAEEDPSPVYAKIPAGTRLFGPSNAFLYKYPATLLKDYFERKYSNVQFVLAAEDTEIAEIHIDDIVFRASWSFYHYQNDWTSVAESLLEYENGYVSISIDIDGMLNTTFLQDYTNGFEYTAEKAQLKCTRTWRNESGSGSDSSYRDLNAATQSTAGVMTAADKTKLDGIATGATANTGTVTSVGITQGSGISVSGGPITTSGSITVSHADTSSLSSSSNSGRTYIQSITLDDYGHITGLATATETVTDTWRPLGTGASDACAGNDSRLSDARPASDVYSWAKASTKPSYGWLEITDRPTLAAVATSGEYEDLIGKPTLSTVASSGNYNDLSNKPTIPTVNNGTLTILRAGTTVATFTANQSGNTTANISIDTDDLSEVRLGPTLSVDEDKELSLSKIRHAEILNLFGSTLNIDEFGRVADNCHLTNLINSGDSILNIVDTGIYNVATTSGVTGGPIPTTSIGDIVVVFCGTSSSVRLYLYHSLYNNNLYYGFKIPSINYITWGRILITDV